MYTKAMEAEAWHYAGVARVIYAYGYMLMTDLHGEMPFTEGIVRMQHLLMTTVKLST